MFVYLTQQTNKKIKIMRTLTAEYRNRAEIELNKAKNLLSKELNFPNNLKRFDLIELYENAISKIEKILTTGVY
jgi:hypothetical protein